MIILWTTAASLWGGLWWRFRGGAFTALTGIDPGTGGMRAIAAFFMAAPLLLIDWRYVAMIPTLWIAWSLAGWGAFQSMGASPIEEKNPVAHFLEKIGITDPTWNDLLGMAIEGVFVMAIVSLVPAFVTHDWAKYPFVAMTGIFFSPLYFSAQHIPRKPDFGRFARGGSEWGEVLVGMSVAAQTTAFALMG